MWAVCSQYLSWHSLNELSGLWPIIKGSAFTIRTFFWRRETAKMNKWIHSCLNQTMKIQFWQSFFFWKSYLHFAFWTFGLIYKWKVKIYRLLKPAYLSHSQKNKKTLIHSLRAQAMFPRCCLRWDYEENIFMVRRESPVQTV